MERMSEDEVKRFVARSRFGQLGLARGGRAYVLPILYGFDGTSFYFHTHPGLKDAYIDMTSEACLTIVRVASEDSWTSVMAFGRLERVVGDTGRLVAYDALMNVPLPPDRGLSPFDEPLRSSAGVEIWRLAVARMSGRKSELPPIGTHEGEIAMGGM